jgi:hypothetical protein
MGRCINALGILVNLWDGRLARPWNLWDGRDARKSEFLGRAGGVADKENPMIQQRR